MALKDVIGQDRAISILISTMRRGRIPSAYLFAGESGIGKRFTALNLAKAINCQRERDALSVMRNAPEGFDSCDECFSCRKIDAGTHPDVLLLVREKNEIIIDEIRAVEDALSFRPYEGRKKVVIVDEADTMNQHAANAFLKTLEEPPEASLLILVAANPDRLPETIRSRCSRVNFVPLSDEVCKSVVQGVSRTSGIEDKKKLDTIVRLSMGRPGLAISSDVLKERDGFISRFRDMLCGSNEAWADRYEMEQWFDFILILLRDVAVFQIKGGAAPQKNDAGSGTGIVNADIMEFISDIAGRADAASIMDIYYRLLLLKGYLDFNLNKAIVWNYAASIINTIQGEGRQ